MAVSKRAIRNSETDIYITPSGEHFFLGASRSRQVLSDEGTGMPPLEMVTQRGPYQDGTTLKNIYLEPRVLQYHIRQRYCNRREYWAARNTLLGVLAPNIDRGLQGTLRKILTDGTIRDLNVTIQQGPGFQPRRSGVWDEWAIDEVLRFIAVDPTYFDPSLQTYTFTMPTDCGQFPYDFPISLICPFIFPITFPIVFAGLEGGEAVEVINNGTWKVYPSFEVTGQVNFLRITNNTTGEMIFISYPSGSANGFLYNIDLTYNSKSVTVPVANGGDNLIGYVSNDSDLGTWHLAPGINEVSIEAYGASGDFFVTMTFNERYIGI